MVTIKQDDTSPILEQTLTDANKNPKNLSNFLSVKFNMRDKYTLKTFISDDTDGNVFVVDAENGRVEYRWDADDTTRSGRYEAEWQVTYADGAVETYPNNGYIPVKIVGDIYD